MRGLQRVSIWNVQDRGLTGNATALRKCISKLCKVSRNNACFHSGRHTECAEYRQRPVVVHSTVSRVRGRRSTWLLVLPQNVCSDALCAYEICGYCYSTSLITHENSRVCVEAQKYNIGCHSCGRQNCFNASPTCHARCTASHHVCGPSVPGGCDNCGRLCHLNNSDPRCAYFQRSRGQLEWRAAPADLMDTVAGTGGTVPHRTQIKWNFNNATVRGRRTITVEGRQ